MVRYTETIESSGVVLEGVVEVNLFALADVDQVPVDDVGELFVEDGAHGLTAEIRARIRRRLDAILTHMGLRLHVDDGSIAARVKAA